MEGMGPAQRCAPGGSASRSCLCQPLRPCAASSAGCKGSRHAGVEFRGGVSSRESFLVTAPWLLSGHCRHLVNVCKMLLSGRERGVLWSNAVFELHLLSFRSEEAY